MQSESHGLREIHIERVDFLVAGVANRHDRIVRSGGEPWAELRIVRQEALQVEKKFSMSIANLDASHIGSGGKIPVFQIKTIPRPPWGRDGSLLSDPPLSPPPIPRRLKEL